MRYRDSSLEVVARSPTSRPVYALCVQVSTELHAHAAITPVAVTCGSVSSRAYDLTAGACHVRTIPRELLPELLNLRKRPSMATQQTKKEIL